MQLKDNRPAYLNRDPGSVIFLASCSRIESRSTRANVAAAPAFGGMRIRVRDMLEMLAGGATPEQILRDSPDLEADDIRASLSYAASQIDHPVLTTAA